MPRFGIRETVFDSAAEHDVFRALGSQWSPPFQVFAQLPLSNVLADPPPGATQTEQNFHRKTSIDFTLCDQNHRPLLSAEFDGMGHGYSREGVYVAAQPVEKDPYRKTKLDYKLRLAKQAGYPMFVVSFDETQPIEQGETLTVLDGIIGRVLARAKGREFAQQSVDEHQQQIDQLEHEADDYISDLVIEADYLAKLEHDAFEIRLLK